MIKLNGEVLKEENINLMELIKTKGFNFERIAVEVNGKIVKRGSYEEVKLKNGDKVEIVCFVGGG
ncbi:sulfur carrier protein [Peptostreptococcus russellii]|uniref:Sulfur carrier protein n=1 Tax=Peptostreptococcus russellii TaxID=215200 RepID=A0A1H8L0S3_9FIRM|nr:sulfur carrier protein ThiS [Peptostreptococcus russellii]SEN98725.1 sulfur carrier protein [Peptostreptococcus russellii]